MSAAVCQPLAARPPRIDSRAASASRWKGCGSNSAAKLLISLLIDTQPTGAVGLPNRRSLPDTVRSFEHSPRAQLQGATTTRMAASLNQAPPATAAALIRPKAASATP